MGLVPEISPANNRLFYAQSRPNEYLNQTAKIHTLSYVESSPSVVGDSENDRA
jgi:hypothetical protein